MIYAFVQNSDDDKVLTMQKAVISAYAKTHSFEINKWLTPSSFNLNLFKKDDVLLLEKIFRLGKDLQVIIETLKALLSNEVVIYSCDDNIKLGGDFVSSLAMAHSFGLVSDIISEWRSSLTKEGLALCRKKGIQIGRPKGRKNTSKKLDAKKDRIQELLKAGKSQYAIGKMLNIPASSLCLYIKENKDLTELIHA